MYAEQYLSPWFGFVVRATYAFIEILAIGAEVTAVAIYFAFWFPTVPQPPWVALVSGLLAAALPKCPLCLAAWLSIFGVTVGAAGMAAVQVLRPVALCVCGLALAVTLLKLIRTAERPAGVP